MRSSLILSALATAAAASPAPSKYYTLSFTVDDNSLVNAALLGTGKSGSYVLQAVRPSENPGSKFVFEGSGDSNLDLIFSPNSRTNAGATAPDVGDDYGYATPITVTAGSKGDGAWSYDKKSKLLGHELHAALEGFFACSMKINGKNATVLSWGVPQSDPNGLPAPVGCEYTTVTVTTHTS